MRIALLAAAALAAAVLAGASPAAPGFDLVSWSDLDHGWASSAGTLYSTNDGGRTWHPILSTGGGQIYHVERTSSTTGTVLAGSAKTIAYWTRDGGRHWFRGDDVLSAAVGHGDMLFATSGPALLQIKPWPPRASVRCHGDWWSSTAGPTTTATKAPRNICSGPAPVAMRATKVFALSGDGQLAPDSLVPIPAGIAGIATDGTPRQRPLSVVVYRAGQALETPLTVPFQQDVGFSGLRLTVVSWPELTLEAQAGSTRVVWDSADGGTTWTIAG